MSRATLNLSSIPIIVLDNILSYLGQSELYDTSLVCKLLYELSKKHLYRNLDNYDEYCSLVTNNLAFNPSLAFYIRTFTSYDPVLLTFLCTLAPLNLHRLIIKWDPEDDMYDFHVLIDLLGTESRVEHMIFTLHTPLEKCLMKHLHCFNGLTRVDLIIPDLDWDAHIFSTQFYSLQDIIDSLNCPTLESLSVENVECGWETLQQLEIGDGLPNFRGLCLRRVEVDYEMGTPCKIMWDILVGFLSRSIYFKIQGSDNYTSFYSLVLTYASQCSLDPAPLIQWLAKSDHFFGVQTKYNRFDLSLQKLSEAELIQILEIIRQVDFDRSDMVFSLCDLPQSLSSSTVSLFYENIVELFIVLADGINLDPDVIQQCIITLPKLEDFFISLLYTDKFIPASTCTTASYYFRPDRKMREEPPSIELEISRGERPVWRIYEFDSKTDCYDIKLRRPGTARGVMALEEEVNRWFQWSKSLRVVGLCFDYRNGSDVGSEGWSSS